VSSFVCLLGIDSRSDIFWGQTTFVLARRAPSGAWRRRTLCAALFKRALGDSQKSVYMQKKLALPIAVNLLLRESTDVVIHELRHVEQRGVHSTHLNLLIQFDNAALEFGR